jgi:hypothetical protein
MKAYDGTLFYFPMDHWLVLRNAKGSRIGCRFLQKGESLSLGAKLSFKQHVVRIGSRIRSDIPMHVEKSNEIVCMPSSGHVSTSKSVPPPVLSDMQSENDVTSSVLDSISMGLDYTHGSNFAKEVNRSFNCSVHPSERSGHFTMVVSFGRAKFKLEEDLVGIALESTIGGYCGNLKVSRLGERVFSFCVANKDVGFHILKLRKYACPQFKCYFYLWGRGGPNWKHEFSLWSKENDQEWMLVSPRKRQISMAMAALKNKPSKSIVRSAKATPKRLEFADSICYDACKGYCNPIGADKREVIMPKNFSVDDTISIPFGTVHDHNDDQNMEVLGTYLDFQNMIDDMVFRVWKYGRCLSMDHEIFNCTNEIRCRNCYKYGHIKRNCLSQKSKVWVPKSKAGQSDKDSVDLIQKDIDALLDSSGAVSTPRASHIGTASSPVPCLCSIFLATNKPAAVLYFA